MKYTTQNEFDHFTFHEVHISGFELTRDMFHVTLDDVIILPENTCNRDIRNMRCNNMELHITDMKVEQFMLEGYKTYDADGKLKENLPDQAVPEAEWGVIGKTFLDGYAYEIKKTQGDEGRNNYTFIIDDAQAEHTYAICVSGTGDMEMWDRFLNVELS